MLMIVEVTRKNKIKILQAPAVVQVQVRTQIRPVQVRPHRRLHQVVEVVQVQARKRRKKLRKNIRNKIIYSPKLLKKFFFLCQNQ